jgi:transposase-like protein
MNKLTECPHCHSKTIKVEASNADRIIYLCLDCASLLVQCRRSPNVFSVYTWKGMLFTTHPECNAMNEEE